MTIGGGSELLEAVIEYADVGFNRVEGYRIGARADDIHLGHHLSFRGGLAYGISDRRTKYEAGMTIYPLATKELGVGGDVFRNLGLRPDTRYYGQFFNSLTSLVARNDYFDYYEREGWKAFLQYTPSERLSAAFTFASEYHSTARQSTDQSFFTLPRQYRPNPVITDGQLRSIRLDLRLGTNEAPFDILPTNTLRVSAEHSPAGFAGSEFTFTRYDALASFVLPTFARSMLFSPQLRVRIGAGASSGTLPPQRWFDPQSGSSGYAPFGTMKAMQVRAYSGTGYVSVSAEHNFRTLPFLALGIPFLYERNLELVVHGGAVRTWGKEGLPLNTTDGWYAEAGIGLSRIFDILRMDLTWRFADPARLIFTMSVAQIL